MSNDSVEVESTKEEEESIEIPNSGGARKSKLVTSGDTICHYYEDTRTTWDIVQRGSKISNNGRCFGSRSFKSDYSWITYNEFIERAEHFGSGLVKMGLTPGQSSNVGIYLQNCLEWTVAQYGGWSQSAIIIPLYDTLGPDACIFIIKQAEIEVAICDNDFKVRNLLSSKKEMPSLKHIITINAISKELNQLAKNKDVKLHFFNDIEDMGKNNPVQKLLPKPSDVCLICYTSGTTGEPKGVILTHENVVSATGSVNFMLKDCAVKKEDLEISYLPLAHIFEQIVQTLMLVNGASIGFFSGDLTKLAEDMKVLQPTVFPAVPRTLNKFYDKAQALIRNKLKSPSYDGTPEGLKKKSDAEKVLQKAFLDNLGGKIRLIFSGSAPGYKHVLEFYTIGLGCKVTEFYGQTECSGPCSLVVLDSYYVGNVGTPISCCMVKLVDVPEMGYMSKNSKGEICIKGPSVFKGYLKDPVKTAETLDNEGWLHTGDIGMWLPNGALKIIDRKKSILKLSQGEYVSPEKIESIYIQSPYVSQVFVHGNSLKSFLVAVVIPDQEVMLPWCKENLNIESWTEICKDPKVKRLIFEDMQRVGKIAGLLSFEQVKKIHLHPETLTYEDGFLTPTLKVKRDFCKKYFVEELEAMYNSIREFS
ncbi:long-chain-fatty-acid--CoA ligase 1 [Caerostris darwini]|uniref:long-chain-fatty-acid--CoA ligase n=1 Tax=Caerostris darwini TaxID=1538125 RepID=A0AAV4SVL9_9ARAC|nr:long-chain-fatty-acid--CoA ligase 1 [Caerostris darwini]